MIAARAIHTALRRIGQDAFFHRGRTNFLGYGLRRIERRSRGLVANEFDADEQTKPADVADVTMGKERSKSSAQRYSRGSDTREKIVRFDVIEYGVARSCCDGMSLVSKSVLERCQLPFSKASTTFGATRTAPSGA